MRTFLALLTAALLLPAAAQAKGILGAKVCGDEGCVRVGHVAGGDQALMGGPPVSAPKERAPFFRIRFKIGEDGKAFGFVRTLYVPSAQLVRGDDGTWMNVPSDTLDALNRLTRGIQPYPAERLNDILRPYRSSAAAASPAPPRPSSDDGGGPPAALWAGLAALALAALAATATIMRRRHDIHHGPAGAG
jgi:hypothetical protein